jgi:amino acid transporter
MGKLIRGLSLLQATSINMNNMIGMGPFITIPLILAGMGGPQAMLGWFVGMIIVLADSMIWCELAAAIPSSGGSYHFLRVAYDKIGLGKLMAFLFIWQFLLSGPLEIASGYIGFSQYLGYLWAITPLQMKFIAAFIGILNLLLLYRDIKHIGKLSVILWVGTLITTAVVIFSGIFRFDPNLAFAFPPGAFELNSKFAFSLGAISSIAIYDYLGYYSICYVGDEVKDPARILPRSILISLVVVATIYVLIYLSVIGVMPWEKAAKSSFVISDFMEMIYGSKVAVAFTLLILWTAMGSVFALLLGYSRIPYAAAKDGNFFQSFGQLHSKNNFPHVSLLWMGGLAIVAAFLPLGDVIMNLLATRILVQFIGQIFAVKLLRDNTPDKARPYKMWLYPLPSIVALIGWLFVFGTSDYPFEKPWYKFYTFWGVVTLLLGVGMFFLWSKYKPGSPKTQKVLK